MSRQLSTSDTILFVIIREMEKEGRTFLTAKASPGASHRLDLSPTQPLDALVIAGTPEYGRECLAQLVDAGVPPAIILPMGYNYEQAMRQLSECIFPHFL